MFELKFNTVLIMIFTQLRQTKVKISWASARADSTPSPSIFHQVVNFSNDSINSEIFLRFNPFFKINFHPLNSIPLNHKYLLD